KAQLASVLGDKLRAEQQYRRALHNFKAVFNREISDPEVDGLVLPKLPSNFLPASEATAVDRALDTNPTLLQLMQAVERAKHIVSIQEAKFYPTFQLVGESQRKEQDQGAEGVRTEQRLGVLVTYNIFSGGSDAEAASAARQDVTSAKKTVLDKRDSVEENVRNAWTDMLIVLEQAKQYENQTNITFEYLSQLKRIQAAGGDVDLTTILIGEKDYISATSAMVTTQIDHIIAAYTLLFQMGDLTPQTVQM
ncbi:MAG: TolC family protein, partial [Desulfovibrionaceae bacterium]